MSGSTAEVNRDTQHRARRRRDRGEFRVIQRHEKGEELYAVIGPSGVALYTFSDLRDATAEAAILNTPSQLDRAKSRG
jgi:hypothetical protein